jgi:hypothetical protein
MSEHFDQAAASPTLTCVGCSKPLEPGWDFCPYCGTKTVPSSATSAIDAYIQNKLTLELSARLKDQTSIVRELADKAEDTVWSRLKRYTVILGIGAAILAYFGLKPLYDIYHQIEPMVNAADQRIQTVSSSTEVRCARSRRSRRSGGPLRSRAAICRDRPRRRTCAGRGPSRPPR